MAKGRLLLQGTIELLSPAIIGCGESNRSDLDIILDDRGKPFIPATSFIGMLKHFITQYHDDNEAKTEAFWGYIIEKKGMQSAIGCSDLLCVDLSPKISLRDGIKISNKTGIVKKGDKFDYEVVESGTKFCLSVDVVFTGETREFCERMIATIQDILKTGDMHIGAKSNSGFGKIRLKDEKICLFDFSQKNDVLRWLGRDFSKPCNLDHIERIPLATEEFVINGSFELKNSLLVRSYPSDPEMPDSVHIHSAGKPVLPGPSLKGAIRSRAERIVNTLEGDPQKGKADEVINDLFGYVNKDTKKKGKIGIDEVVLPKFIAELQTRIKIDRFTGGTVESALFEPMPLFSNLNEKIHNVTITIRNCKEYEAGLMLLVLKDLWTGDLAVGGEKGVGRGVFSGYQATILCNNHEPLVLEKDISRASPEVKERLQKYVDALVSYMKGERENAK